MKGDTRYLRLHPEDNVVVGLQDLQHGAILDIQGTVITLTEDIPAKHKISLQPMTKGDPIIMYGVLVGRAVIEIPSGAMITVANIEHDTATYGGKQDQMNWVAPDVSHWKRRTFAGYHRADGKVGTRNYWLVFPLVFCENRNIHVIKEAMLEQLGYVVDRHFAVDTQSLINLYQNGSSVEEILGQDIIVESQDLLQRRLFTNVDGIKFLTHSGGCGGTRDDSETLCRLLASYVSHPNVAGATVLSLGCQNAQIQVFKDALDHLAPNQTKPIYYLEQQESHSERAFIADAVKHTFVGLIGANKTQRTTAPLSHLCLGLECGGSDGFSGISANPALGHTSDLLAALEGSTVLAEFPELNGVEQELIDRCTSSDLAQRFSNLMGAYSKAAERVGSGFKHNPSPGNIKDGLITDAIKSAGAAKKGGTSPITGVLDYTEQVKGPGLHLLCTPGGDVESTTGLAGAGANLIVFTTGLGTPTGNPITPVVKMSTNTKLATLMADLIDIDAGTIISGEDTISTKGEELLDYLIKVASGEELTAAERLGQDDFIPWKRGISL